jgi:hypothetical protein
MKLLFLYVYVSKCHTLIPDPQLLRLRTCRSSKLWFGQDLYMLEEKADRKLIQRLREITCRNT